MNIIFDVINPTYVRKGFLNVKFLIWSILCQAKHFTILIFDLFENEPDV